jgi:spore maturation protein CgeB
MTLNITRKEMAANGYCPSGRFFEAAACGTPIVSDHFGGLEQFFDLKEEVLVVRSAGDVANAMSLVDSQLQKLAQNARERTLSSHTGECRAVEVLKYFDEAWSGSPHTMANRNTPESRFGAAS